MDTVSNNLRLNIRTESKLLKQKYKLLGIAHHHPVWNFWHLFRLDEVNFISDNIYVWQTREYSEQNYLVSYDYASKNDQLNLLASISELGDFGVQFFSFYGKKVSRDLIDSVIEINYLDTQLEVSKIANLSVLDIGAGYGRFAYRLISAFPNAKVTCVDAIPISTSISKVYLKQMIESSSVQVSDLSEVGVLKKDFYHLAINIHSFSEMSIESIRFWIKILVENKVKYIFIVPNKDSLSLNDGTDFGYLFSEAGYKIFDSRKKYSDSESDELGIYPSTYFLLELA